MNRRVYFCSMLPVQAPTPCDQGVAYALLSQSLLGLPFPLLRLQIVLLQAQKAIHVHLHQSQAQLAAALLDPQTSLDNRGWLRKREFASHLVAFYAFLTGQTQARGRIVNHHLHNLAVCERPTIPLLGCLQADIRQRSLITDSVAEHRSSR